MRTEQDALKNPMSGDEWSDDAEIRLLVCGVGKDGRTGKPVVIYRAAPDFWDRVVLLKSFKRRIRNASIVRVAQIGGAE